MDVPRPLRFLPFIALFLAGCGGAGGGAAKGAGLRVAALDTIQNGLGYATDVDGSGVKFGLQNGNLTETIDGGIARNIPLTGAGVTSATPWGGGGGYLVATTDAGTLAIRKNDGVVTLLPGRTPLFISGTRLMSLSNSVKGLYNFDDLAQGSSASFRITGDFTPLGLSGTRLLYRRNGAAHVRDLADGTDNPVATPPDATSVSPELILGPNGAVLGSATLADGTHLFLAKDGTATPGPLLIGVSGNVVPTALSRDAGTASFTWGSAGYIVEWNGISERLTISDRAASTGLLSANGDLSRGLVLIDGVQTSIRIERR